MRETTLVLNSVVVVFFICFIAYTFVARQHLESLARGFVTKKTLEYSDPIVEIVEKTLDSPLVKKVLSDDHLKAIGPEIADYRLNPAAYVADLTRQQARHVQLAKGNPLVVKVASIKSRIRTYYDDTLNALVVDLRIFSFSNLVAGLIAFGLAYRSATEVRKPIVWFSLLMFVATLYCSALYIDDLTFFRILFRLHMGWWYPVTLCVMIVALYMEYGHHAATSERKKAPRAANDTVSM